MGKIAATIDNFNLNIGWNKNRTFLNYDNYNQTSESIMLSKILEINEIKWQYKTITHYLNPIVLYMTFYLNIIQHDLLLINFWVDCKDEALLLYCLHIVHYIRKYKNMKCVRKYVP